jgi:hypothetical protein
MRRTLYIAGAGLAAGLAAWWLGAYAVPIVFDLLGRGRRLSHTKLVDGPDDPDDKTIEEDPDKLTYDAWWILGRPAPETLSELHAARDALAASRMVRSEEPEANDQTKQYLVHVAINDARRKGLSLFEVLTISSVSGRRGFFGKQTTRRYSTREDSYERDLLLAESAIATHDMGDPTGGATKFYHEQILPVAGVASLARVTEEWGQEGLRPYRLPGAPARLWFFGREGAPVA